MTTPEDAGAGCKHCGSTRGMHDGTCIDCGIAPVVEGHETPEDVCRALALGDRLIEAAHDAARERRVFVPLGRFKLRTLVAVQNRVEAVRRAGDYVCPFSPVELAVMSYALGALSAERLAAGERLTPEDDEALAAAAAAPVERDETRDAELDRTLVGAKAYAGGEKPPLGVAPPWLWRELVPAPDRADLEARVSALEAAIARRKAAAREPLGAWRRELALRWSQLAELAGGDPPGDDPVELWREWCSRDITETDDGWATFTNRVHAMLERRGIKP